MGYHQVECHTTNPTNWGLLDNDFKKDTAPIFDMDVETHTVVEDKVVQGNVGPLLMLQCKTWSFKGC